MPMRIHVLSDSLAKKDGYYVVIGRSEGALEKAAEKLKEEREWWKPIENGGER